MQSDQRPWFWQGVAYEIYPRSFYDSNGDGVGDLKGITAKLDYLRQLGIGAIWLCPFYTSPMADFGYDVADYYDVDPVFGSLEDFSELVQQAHTRGIKVLVDLVVNHTSDEHSWFKESRESRDNPKRDWYLWQPPHPSGSPPNNWRSVFGGSAWEYDSMTSQYYLHSFSVKQPDLNWTNPEVRAAIKSVITFWLNLGVDGFRADAVNWMSKDMLLRDDPPNPTAPQSNKFDYDALQHKFSEEGPQLYNYLKDITEDFGNYSGRFVVVEVSPNSSDQVQEYLKFYEYVDERHCAPFIFEPIFFSNEIMRLKDFVDRFQSQLKPDYLPIYTLGTHDKPRLASRVGSGPLRLMAMMQLTLPGMPFIYYGEEIGMHDVVIPAGQQKDIMYGSQSRDASRTPMQWDISRNAGFSQGLPWLPVSDDYTELNVQVELAQSGSLLHFYRALIRLRNDSPVLRYGAYQGLDLGNDIYGYARHLDGQRMVVVMNFRSESATVPLGELKGRIILATDATPPELSGVLQLGAEQGVIIALESV